MGWIERIRGWRVTRAACAEPWHGARRRRANAEAPRRNDPPHLGLRAPLWPWSRMSQGHCPERPGRARSFPAYRYVRCYIWPRFEGPDLSRKTRPTEWRDEHRRKAFVLPCAQRHGATQRARSAAAGFQHGPSTPTPGVPRPDKQQRALQLRISTGRFGTSPCQLRSWLPKPRRTDAGRRRTRPTPAPPHNRGRGKEEMVFF